MSFFGEEGPRGFGRVLRQVFEGTHNKMFTFGRVWWYTDYTRDAYVCVFDLVSDYPELANMPVRVEFDVTGLEIAAHRTLNASSTFVIDRMREKFDAAARNEYDRWITMLAYLGRTEEN